MSSHPLYASTIAIVLSVLTLHRIDCLAVPKTDPSPIPLIPTADGKLHMYMLPVGQGDAHVIQCPRGDLTIMDLGTSDGANQGFWHNTQLHNFLNGQFNLIKNVIISHNHQDHTSFLGNVLSSAKGLTGLTNIYVSCNQADMATATVNWLNDIGGVNKLRLFNGGNSCGPNGQACGALDICPGDSAVTATVFAANMGNCGNSNKNLDSIVFKVVHNQVSLMFNGDFEDASATTNGNQNALVNYYGAQLYVTAFKLSHHGAENLANKMVYLNAHRPKALFVSANFRNSNYRHPRCNVINRMINDVTVKTLCKPAETVTTSPFYCGVHTSGTVPINDKLQQKYWCGEEATGVFRTVTNNEYALYMTTQDDNIINLVVFTSDGTRWGFINNFQPKLATSGLDDSNEPTEIHDDCGN